MNVSAPAVQSAFTRHAAPCVTPALNPFKLPVMQVWNVGPATWSQIPGTVGVGWGAPSFGRDGRKTVPCGTQPIVGDVGTSPIVTLERFLGEFVASTDVLE